MPDQYDGRIFHFDQRTGALLGEGKAEPSPARPGAWLFPSFSTPAEPPLPLETKTEAVYRKADGSPAIGPHDGQWFVVPDWRGTSYWLPDGSEYKIDKLGEAPPPEALFVQPAPSVEISALSRKRDMDSAFSATLASGYTCSNGIKMDATDADVRKLDDGYRLTQRLGVTVMDVRDYNNVRHMNTPLATVEQMVNELGANWLRRWTQKCEAEEAIDAILAANTFTKSDPSYLDDDTARTAIANVNYPAE